MSDFFKDKSCDRETILENNLKGDKVSLKGEGWSIECSFQSMEQKTDDIDIENAENIFSHEYYQKTIKSAIKNVLFSINDYIWWTEGKFGEESFDAKKALKFVDNVFEKIKKEEEF